jgi:CheY-like chemotaxis protein
MHQVLVVDDDEDIRESLVDFFEDHGYEAVGAVHGRDALDRLSTHELQPCVIILDLMMPVMDGKEFREEQLGHPDISRIPVVVISAYKDVAENAKSLNVASTLAKPLDLSTLLRAVQKYCPT